jgi:hypothetical protein
MHPIRDEGIPIMSHYNVSEQPLCGPTVVGMPQVIGCTAVLDRIQVLGTIGSIPASTVSVC